MLYVWIGQADFNKLCYIKDFFYFLYWQKSYIVLVNTIYFVRWCLEVIKTLLLSKFDLLCDFFNCFSLVLVCSRPRFCGTCDSKLFHLTNRTNRSNRQHFVHFSLIKWNFSDRQQIERCFVGWTLCDSIPLDTGSMA